MLGEAMEAGVLDEPRARAFVQWTMGLSDDQAAQVIAGLLPVAAGLLVGALIDRIKRAAIAIDPGWAERRYRAAVKGRRVEGSRNDDGTANVQGLDLPVDRAAAACDRIDALARACKRAGDWRLTRPAPELTVWTSPLGRTYTNRPPSGDAHVAHRLARRRRSSGGDSTVLTVTKASVRSVQDTRPGRGRVAWHGHGYRRGA